MALKTALVLVLQDGSSCRDRRLLVQGQGFNPVLGRVFFMKTGATCCFHSGCLVRSPPHHTGQEQLLGEGVYFDLCLIFLLLRFSLLEQETGLETGHKSQHGHKHPD